MVDDTARDRAIYHALKAADEIAAALQTHLIEEHGADPERAARYTQHFARYLALHRHLAPYYKETTLDESQD